MSTNPQPLTPLTKTSETETTPDKPQPAQWLLPGVIPLSAVSCIIGTPECGKSSLIHWLAAKVSAKEPTLFRGDPIPQGNVVICGDDEEYVKTTRSTLVENGANTANVLRIVGSNVNNVTKALKAVPSCRLIIFDPCEALFSIDENKSHHVKELEEVAVTSGAAIVLVTHCFTTLIRTIWAVTKTYADNIHTATCVKMNLCENRDGFSFEIVSGYKGIQVNILDEQIPVEPEVRVA